MTLTKTMISPHGRVDACEKSVLLSDAWENWKAHEATFGRRPSGLEFTLRLMQLLATLPGCTFDPATGLITGTNLGVTPKRTSVAALKLSDIAAEAADWLWLGMLARGRIHLLGGDPGQGKSQLCAYVAAVCTKGGEWPCGGGRAPLGSVLYWSGEEDPAMDIKPRIMAAGGDTRKIVILPHDFEASNIELLDEMAERLGDVVLFVADPIDHAMGDRLTKLHIRRTMSALTQWARRRRIACLFILHPPKGKAATQSELFGGSAAYRQFARVTFYACPDPKDDRIDGGRKFLLADKANILPDKSGHAYFIEGVQLPGGICAPCVRFENERIAVSAADLLKKQKPEKENKKHTQQQAAESWLLQRLRGAGLTPYALIKSEGEEVGYSHATLQRAGAAIGVKRQGGSGAPSFWILD